MKDSLIPWHVFLVALEDQLPQDLQNWLERWRFGDAGVALLQDTEAFKNSGTESRDAD